MRKPNRNPLPDLWRRIRKTQRRYQRAVMTATGNWHNTRKVTQLRKRIVKLLRRFNSMLLLKGAATISAAGLLYSPLPALAQPTITALAPDANDIDVATTSNIEITFSQIMINSTLGPSTIRIYGSQTGFLSTTGSFSSGIGTRTFNPDNDFKTGEKIAVTVTTDAMDGNFRNMAEPQVYQFRTETYGKGIGLFNPIELLGSGRAVDISMGDLNGDGNVDAIVANTAGAFNLLFGNGNGTFSTGTTGLGSTHAVALGDLDGDGDLDAIGTRVGGQAAQILVNNGDGIFTSSSFGGADNNRSVSIGDLDGDGDLDAIIGARATDPQEIWLNNGNATFTSSTFGNGITTEIALGDIDGDGDLDAVLGGRNTAQHIWFNNGDATFTTGVFGTGFTLGVELADLDGDNDLDAVIANADDEAQEIWLNNGDGTFTSSTFGAGDSQDLAVGDLDSDGDLDVIINNYDGTQEIWFNNGDATFTSAAFASGNSDGIGMADIDNDGDLDVIVCNREDPFGIWLNVPLVAKITDITPATNAIAVAPAANIRIDFNTAMRTSALEANSNLFLHGGQSGLLTTSALISFANTNATVQIDPSAPFHPGETLELTIRDALSTGGSFLVGNPQVVRFQAAVDRGLADFKVQSQSAGANPIAIAVGDFNGDRIQDALVGSDGFSPYYVLLGNGDATFATTSFGLAPVSEIALGDLDGDGDLDALVAINGGFANQILLNNGDATFTTSSMGDFARTQGVKLGDLDGDGDLDAVFANIRTDGADYLQQIWLNNGDATFTESSFGSGKSEGLDIGDLDNDGDLDVIIANIDNQPEDIWLNNGDATFTATTFGSNLTDSRDVVIGDLDGDGDLDAIVANDYGQPQSVWLNNGDATFTSTTFGARNTQRLSLGDLDADGDLDVIAINFNQHQDIWLNKGDATFTSTTFGLTDGQSVDLDIGDIDGDGDLDAMLINESSDIVLWLNRNFAEITALDPAPNAANEELDAKIHIDFLDAMQSTSLVIGSNLLVHGSFSGSIVTQAAVSLTNANTRLVIDPPQPFKTGERIDVSLYDAKNVSSDLGLESNSFVYSFIAETSRGTGEFVIQSQSGGLNPFDSGIGDLDGDGNLDVLIANTQSLGYHVLLGSGDGTFSSSKFGARNTFALALGDLDGDGDLDAIGANSNETNDILLNNGDGTFSSATFGGTDDARGVRLGDLDGDGDLDAIIANYYVSGAAQEIWLNNGNGTFTSSTFGTGNSNDVVIGDIDNDGDLDVLIANSGNNFQHIWYNNGDATFTTASFVQGLMLAVELGDLDTDGDLDAIFAGSQNNPQSIWLNNGDGTFASSSFGGGDSHSLDIADLDADGDLDVIIANINQPLDIWFNNGDATFSSSSFDGGVSFDLEFGDLDDDGDMDAVVSKGQDQSLDIWLNISTPRITSISPSTNAIAVPANTNIEVDFDDVMDPTTFVTNSTVFMHGSNSGSLSTLANMSFTNANRSFVFDPMTPFRAGEKISFVINQVKNVQSGIIDNGPQVRQFTTDVNRGTGIFSVVTQSGGANAKDVVIGDLNGDGILDAIVASIHGVNSSLLIGKGDGTFMTSTLSTSWTVGLALGDIDNDGDLDVLAANAQGQLKDIMLNNGDASFSVSQFGGANASDVDLGDLDADGDLDAVFSVINAPQEIWLNNGDGTFTSSTFGSGFSEDVAIGDIDNDNDLDVIIANRNFTAQEIWYNNGDASFTSTHFGGGYRQAVELGDLDNDGDLDAVLVGGNASSQAVWLNNGDGSFSRFLLGSNDSVSLDIGDLDDDDDLDVIIANEDGSRDIWFNNGDASFSTTTFGDGNSSSIEMADLDDDGDLDAIVYRRNVGMFDVWLNQPLAPTITSLAPSTTTASLNLGGFELSGTEFERVTSVQLTQLNSSGVTIGSIELPFTVNSLTNVSVQTPAGALSTIGTLTLTLFNSSSSTNAQLSVINDRPLISTNNTAISVNEDQTTDIFFSLGDVSPGVTGLTVSAPVADLTTIASIMQIGATAATTRFRIVPVTNASGSVPLTFVVNDGDLQDSQEITFTINPVNDPPSISAFESTAVTTEDNAVSSAVILFDPDTPFANLILTATSSNQSLITTAGIVLRTTEANTKVRLNPVVNATGSALITVFASDGEFTRSTTFTFQVNPLNDPPIISRSTAQVAIDEDNSTSAVIGLSDIDTPFSKLILTATSSNQSLVTHSGLSFGATGANTNLFIDPLNNASGNAIITVSAFDGDNTRSTSFTLNIAAVNDPPTVAVTNATLNGAEERQVSTALILVDVDTPVSNLILTATSSSQSLVTNGGLSFVTTGATTKLFINPVRDASGSAQIWVSVDDGEFTRSTSLNYNVAPVNDPPSVALSSLLVNSTEDVATSLTVLLSDVDTPFTNLILTAESDNLSLVTSGGLSFSATDANTTLFINPVENANGNAFITVWVSDGQFRRKRSFNLQVAAVNDPPLISVLNAGIISEENSVTTTTLLLEDPDTAFADLDLRVTSSNQSLIRNENIGLSSTGATVLLTLTPECTANGTAQIAVSLSDGVFTRSTSLLLTVNAVAPLFVTGASCACPDIPVRYEALPEMANSTHTWLVVGGQIQSGQGSGAIDLVWDDAATFASISVTRTFYPGCTTTAQLMPDVKEIQTVLDFVVVSGASAELDILNNDLGSNLTVASLQGPMGSVLTATGATVSFTPPAEFSGIAWLSYTAQDPSGCTATGAIVAVVPNLANEGINLEFVEMRKNRKAGVRGLRAAISSVISPDGAFVYVAGRNDHSIAIFERNTTSGSLNYIRRVRHNVNGVTGLKHVNDLTISSDGRRLYAAGFAQDALVVFERDLQSGDLNFIERKRRGNLDGALTIRGMQRPRSVAVSPDGQTIVAGGNGDNSIAVFRFNPITGGLTFIESHRNGAAGVRGLKQTLGLAFSLDGRDLYVAGSGNDAIVHFRHDLLSGTVHYENRYVDNQNGINGLDMVTGVAVSPDGKHVYASGFGDDAVAVFARNSSDGSLSFVEVLQDGVGGINGLDGINAVNVSPDGAHVWAAGQSDDALVVFERNQTTGELKYIENVKDGLAGVKGLNGISMSVNSRLSEHVYTSAKSDDAVAVFFRNRTPQALDDVSGSAVKNSTLTIKPLLNDSDADNHILTIDRKTHGALGTVTITGGGTTLDYASGAVTGPDSFSYTIVDGHGGSSTATVFVNVVAAKTGINITQAETANSGLTVKPNPARENVNIEFQLAEEVQIELRLYDLVGNEIVRDNLGDLNKGTHTIGLQLRDASGRKLPAGMYILELHLSEGEVLIGRILVR